MFLSDITVASQNKNALAAWAETPNARHGDARFPKSPGDNVQQDTTLLQGEELPDHNKMM